MLEEANPRTNAAGETESCDSLDNCTSGDHRQWLFSQNSTSSIHQYLEGNGDLQVSKGADIHCSSVRDVTNRKDEHAFKNCLSWQQIQQIIQKGRLHRVDLAQRGITPRHANLIKSALLNNPQLICLKLSYNQLRDQGCVILAPAIRLHPSLKTLDIGFNFVGDIGCEAIATSLRENAILETLYLGGNQIRESGARQLAFAAKSECNIACLHLTANEIGPQGMIALSSSIKERILLDDVSRRCVSFDPLKNSNPCRFALSCDPPVSNLFMRDLYLGGTAMGSEGCAAISKMILSHNHLRLICLANNRLQDIDLILLSNSFSENKPLHLVKLDLAFNNFTCTGVEALMNSVWGAPNLREIKIDNNKIKDRGAQLAAVLTTSVDLEVLDLGFNLISSCGVKTLMKAIADSSTIKSLTLSGNALDTHSAKSTSFALALNRSLQQIYLDHCSIAFTAQRHITAGIVSNKESSLNTLTGFSLGEAAVTLGFPPEFHCWTNDKLLAFIRNMWCDHIKNISHYKISQSNDDSVGQMFLKGGAQSRLNEIADAKLVVEVAKEAYAKLGKASHSDDCRSRQAEIASHSQTPVLPARQAIVEVTENGEVEELSSFNIELLFDSMKHNMQEMSEDSTKSFNTPDISSPPSSHDLSGLQCWLAKHAFELEKLSLQPFDVNELSRLRDYYYSPMYLTSDAYKGSNNALRTCYSRSFTNLKSLSNLISPNLATSNLKRKQSYRHLNEANEAPAGCKNINGESMFIRSRSYSIFNERGDGNKQLATKRPRNNKTRISFYPRIQHRLDDAGDPLSVEESLVLFRRLEYTEQHYLETLTRSEQRPFQISESISSNVKDVEAILLDLI